MKLINRLFRREQPAQSIQASTPVEHPNYWMYQ